MIFSANIVGIIKYLYEKQKPQLLYHIMDKYELDMDLGST